MKTNFRLLILICALPLVGNAQSRDSFLFLGNAFDADWNKGSAKLSGDFVAGSNAVNTRLFNDVLFRATFTESAKQQFLDGSSIKNNIYAESRASAEYKLTEKWGIRVKFKSLVGFHSDKELSELLLLGNGSFQGAEVKSENVRYIRSSNLVLGATQNLISNEKFQVKLGYGVSFLTGYRSVQAKELSVFTSPVGSYLDVTVDDAELSTLSSGLQGVGVEGDLGIRYMWNRSNTLVFSASDFNLTRLLDNETITFDSTFRFTGLQLNFLSDSTSIENYVDSSYNSTIDRGRSTRKWASLPSRVQVGWQHKLSCRTMLLIEASAIDLGDLGVTGRAGITHEFSNKLKVLTALGYGNFQGIVWNAAAEYRVGKASFYLSTQSLHALVMPELATNYGASFGVAAQF
jgi:hypothetical protein